jgi:hypothetical protein
MKKADSIAEPRAYVKAAWMQHRTASRGPGQNITESEFLCFNGHMTQIDIIRGGAMLKNLNAPIIPIFFIILLLGLYFTRWEHETSFKPSESIQVKYKTDRWTGERWIAIYAPLALTGTDRKSPTSVEAPDKATKEERDKITRQHALLSYTWTGLFILSLIWIALTLKLLLKR